MAADTGDAAAVAEAGAGRRETARDAAALDLLERSRRALERMHPDDREAAIEVHERIEAALASGDETALREACDALKELLFFVES